MSVSRVRAYAPEIIGAVLAVILTVVVWLTSEATGKVLHLHANRMFITSGGAAIIALTDSIVLLVVVLVVHAQQTTSIAAFFINEVAKHQSRWRRGMLYFLTYEWPIALALFVLSFT